MDARRWQQVKEIVGPALELAPAERPAYLESVCADADLRREVLSFLEAYERHSDFLDTPQREALLDEARGGLGLARGDAFGGYRIVRRLGKGGMGEVFLAEQEEPIRRTVALKLIRPDRSHRRAMARFEAERQSLALMSHSNIAQVFEAGDGEGGRPFLAMEYVRGRPITEYCDGEKLSIEDRLTLLIDVCLGVQHAHQKGVIHRDLKPSNVLVTLENGRAVPKIIDFGIAKRLALPVAEAPLLTHRGEWIGTPEYVSPEQAGGAEDEVDARTDVYSLGVLLYELLTGTLPFDIAQLREAGLAELLRVLREEESPRPSDRIQSLGDAAEAAGKRRLGVDEWVRRLRGDLDHAVLRALEKEPDRRYASAAELAADLGRHLRHEPLLAGPAGALYPLRKLVRRHRFGFLAAGVLAASLLAGILGTGLGLLQARSAEAIAREQAEQAREEAERADRERATAVQVTEYLMQIFNPHDPGSSLTRPDVTLREILDRAVALAPEELSGRPLVQARVLSMLGESYRRMGARGEAREAFETALAIQRSRLGEENLAVAWSLYHLGLIRSDLAEYEDGRRLLEEAVGIRRRLLGDGDLEVARVLDDLGLLLKNSGELEAAREAFEEALRIKEALEGGLRAESLKLPTTLNNLGLLHFRVGEPERAAAYFEEALERLLEVLPEDHPELSYSLNNLAMVRSSEGDLTTARALFQRALKVDEKTFGPNHLNVAIGLYNLANVSWKQGDCRAAEPLFRRVDAILEPLYPKDHPRRLDLAQTLEELRRECPELLG